MKVSVLMVVYNHERFVRQAVDSVLCQQTDFEFEVVVGEDHSTDSTREILRKLDQENPGRLRLLFRDSNLGMSYNFVDTYEHCQGEFVTILDGDDYWSNPHKLAKQVALLEANPDAALCFGRARIEYESGAASKVIPPEQRNDWPLEELLIASFIPACTVMYRHYDLGPIPEWIHELSLCDWPFHVLHALRGKMLLLDEELAVYRVHGGGCWSQLQEDARLFKEIDFYRAILTVLPQPYQRVARAQLLERLYDQANKAYREGRTKDAKTLFAEALASERPGAKLPLRRKLRMGHRLSKS